MAESTTTSNTYTAIPSYLQSFFEGPSGFANKLTTAGQQFPDIYSLAQQVPSLNVPNLTPEQMQVINAMMSSGMSSPDLTSARTQLDQLTSGQIGSSPATVAGMKAFQEQVAPQIMQTAALQGTASGGGAIDAMQRGATEAAVPLIQQEISNREAAVGQYGALQSAQMNSLSMALEASGMSREVAQQQSQALYDAAMKKFGIEMTVQMGPMDLLGALLGSSKTTASHPTMTGEDWTAAGLSAVGGGLSSIAGGGK